MRCHFLSKASFKFDIDGWYCVTKGKISFFSLLLCFSAVALPVNFIPDMVFSIRLHG